MGIATRVRCGALGAALTTTSLFLLACTPDRMQPAPVYMMGATTQPDRDRSAPAIAAPHSTVAAERRQASAASGIASSVPMQHSLKPAANAPHHPSGIRNAHSRIATRHAAAPKKRPSTYPVAGSAAAPVARAKMIPLDDIAAQTPPAPTVSPATATSSEPTTSTWVSPEPTDPPHVEFRPPSPSGS
jgi:hypothetical protein